MDRAVRSFRKWQQAYDFIRTGVLEGRWAPGERISAYQIAEATGISRTPIQQALHLLEQEGMLRVIPQVGCVVRGPSAEDIEENFRVRAALEELAGQLAAERASTRDLGLLDDILADSERCLQRRDGRAYAEQNRRFHLAIYQLARSPKLGSISLSLWDEIEYRVAAASFFATRMELSFGQHQDIRAAIGRRDAEAAGALLRQHVESCRLDFARFARDHWDASLQAVRESSG